MGVIPFIYDSRLTIYDHRWVKIYPVEKREMYAEAKSGTFSKLPINL